MPSPSNQLARCARRLLAGCALLLIASAAADEPALARDAPSLVALGREFFFDTNLSRARTLACATCHDPARAFTDGRDGGVAGAASRGDDGVALGDRNTPSAAYAALTPPFGRNAAGEYRGGLFLDGRAVDLSAQAAEPFVNPLEMALPDAAAVVARVRENPHYVASLREHFGAEVFDDTTQAFAAITASLSAFQRSDFFAPFDSRYDRFLRGEYQLSVDEELGRRLFFSDLVNCSSCHLLHTMAPAPREPFTDYRYHNIGVPPNARLRAANGSGPAHVDRGLADNPAVADPAEIGKFKTPTLRNVAVTAPYMHNGVFRDLETALHFYNRHIVDSAASRTNPETGAAWAPAEVADNLADDLLRQGQPLDAQRIQVLIAFLRTLTDRRYEALLEPAPPPPDYGAPRP